MSSSKVTSISVPYETYQVWEDVMFQEHCRSISAFIRKCVDYYINEKYHSDVKITTM